MKRLMGLCALGALLGTATNVLAQSGAAKPAAGSISDPRPTTTTTSGDTGLWLVPTAEVLLHKKWSISFNQVNADDGQGFTNLNRFPVTFGVGLVNRVEIFGGWSIRGQRSGSRVGDAWLGGKINLRASRTGPLAVAVRAQVKLPVGDDTAGVSSGKADFQVDGIVSTHTSIVELSGFGGLMVRGNPSAYQLTNGVRWGVGAAFPSIMRSGFRITTEVVGEHYVHTSMTAPAGLLGEDGSTVPTVTFLKDPVLVNVGLTWQAANGFFIGGGATWNMTKKTRSDAAGLALGSFLNVPDDQAALQVRIGYSPGTNRNRAVPAPPPPPPPNRPPIVEASCDPCRVEVGRTAIVSADAQDPDGDALTYQWTTAAGTLASPTNRQSRWTAPQQPGRVQVTVTISDGKGGTAQSTTVIEVVAPPRGGP